MGATLEQHDSRLSQSEHGKLFLVPSHCVTTTSNSFPKFLFLPPPVCQPRFYSVSTFKFKTAKAAMAISLHTSSLPIADSARTLTPRKCKPQGKFLFIVTLQRTHSDRRSYCHAASISSHPPTHTATAIHAPQPE